MDWVTFGAIVLFFTLMGMAVGFGIGQMACRHDVRKHLWILFHVIDTEPSAGKIRIDILEIIKRLEV